MGVWKTFANGFQIITVAFETVQVSRIEETNLLAILLVEGVHLDVGHLSCKLLLVEIQVPALDHHDSRYVECIIIYRCFGSGSACFCPTQIPIRNFSA